MSDAMLRIPAVNCPAPDLLVSHALGGENAAITRHLEGCADCRAEVTRLRDAAKVMRGGAALASPARTQCLDEFAVADFAAGHLSPEARAPVVAHLLECARCRSLVRSAGAAVAEEAAAQSAVARRRRWTLPVGLAAAAVLVLLALPREVIERTPVPGRREPASPVHAPVPIAPRAAVARVDRLVWSRVPGADQYRVRLFGNDQVLWTVETVDTTAAVPDSVALALDTPYFWRVEARVAWQRWSPSDLVEFRLTGRQ